MSSNTSLSTKNKKIINDDNESPTTERKNNVEFNLKEKNLLSKSSTTSILSSEASPSLFNNNNNNNTPYNKNNASHNINNSINLNSTLKRNLTPVVTINTTPFNGMISKDTPNAPFLNRIKNYTNEDGLDLMKDGIESHDFVDSNNTINTPCENVTLKSRKPQIIDLTSDSYSFEQSGSSSNDHHYNKLLKNYSGYSELDSPTPQNSNSVKISPSVTNVNKNINKEMVSIFINHFQVFFFYTYIINSIYYKFLTIKNFKYINKLY